MNVEHLAEEKARALRTYSLSVFSFDVSAFSMGSLDERGF